MGPFLVNIMSVIQSKSNLSKGIRLTKSGGVNNHGILVSFPRSHLTL